jgi:hypothetical protein
MSWVAAATTVGGELLSNQSGGGPAAPSIIESGKVDFGGINLAPKPSATPPWMTALLVGVLVVVTGGLFLLIGRPSRR